MRFDNNPPGPTSRFSCRIYWDLFRDPLSFLKRASREYGDICYMRFGSRRDYLINHPDLVQKVILAPEIFDRSTSRVLRKMLGRGLLTTDLESHSRQKTYLQPAFHKQQVLDYASTMCVLAQKLSLSWESREAVDVSKEMNRVALDVVVKSLLGFETSRQGNDIVAAIETIKDLTDQKKSAFVDALLSGLPLPRNIAYQKASDCLERAIYDIIEQRRSQPSGGKDLVSTLLNARESGNCPFLSDQLVRDEVMTMFMAGHETIASAMTWTWYLLSRNPDMEERFHAEIDAVLGAGPMRPEHVSELVFTRKVFLESMRIYPPVWLMVRHPLMDTELGGYQIPSGSYIHLCQYTMHRDPRYFPDPEKFDPERWTPGEILKRPKYSYFPFGGGKRKCIGEEFAMTEGIIVLATLAHRWRLRRVSEDPVELEPLITLRPKHGLRMTLQKRILKGEDENTIALRG